MCICLCVYIYIGIMQFRIVVRAVFRMASIRALTLKTSIILFIKNMHCADSKLLPLSLIFPTYTKLSVFTFMCQISCEYTIPAGWIYIVSADENHPWWPLVTEIEALLSEAGCSLLFDISWLYLLVLCNCLLPSLLLLVFICFLLLLVPCLFGRKFCLFLWQLRCLLSIFYNCSWPL